MPRFLLRSVMYSVTIVSLIALDYILGHGVVKFVQNSTSKFLHVIHKSIKDEDKLIRKVLENDDFSLSVMLTEIVFLGLSVLILHKYKQLRCGDRIDELLQDSRAALRQTNELLDKWRMRRMNMHLQEHTYLDEEPQQLTPYTLEVPILHMAIIDTLGATRNQPESGDARDQGSYTDSTLLSMTSLYDDDLDYDITETNEKVQDLKNTKDRVLWDVSEEEGDCLVE